MSDIDYDALRGSAGGDPPDGIHNALLVRAKLVPTANGTRLVTEWQVAGLTPYYWATWFAFDGNRLGFAQEFLDGLGVDRSNITDDDAFEQALDMATDKRYAVRTSAWSGGINVYIEEASDNGQQQLGDVPIETEGLPGVEPTATGVPVAPGPDEDIPF